MSNIKTHSAWNVDLDALRANGVDIEVKDEYADIALSEPAHGEKLIGELTPDERALYAALVRTHQTLEGLGRDYVGAAIERMGSKIRSSDPTKPLHQQMKDGDIEMDFGSDENRLEFFRLQQQAALLHANLYWSVGERLGVHDWSVGVRTRFRVVKVAQRG